MICSQKAGRPRGLNRNNRAAAPATEEKRSVCYCNFNHFFRTPTGVKRVLILDIQSLGETLGIKQRELPVLGSLFRGKSMTVVTDISLRFLSRRKICDIYVLQGAVHKHRCIISGGYINAAVQIHTGLVNKYFLFLHNSLNYI